MMKNGFGIDWPI